MIKLVVAFRNFPNAPKNKVGCHCWRKVRTSDVWNNFAASVTAGNAQSLATRPKIHFTSKGQHIIDTANNVTWSIYWLPSRCRISWCHLWHNNNSKGTNNIPFTWHRAFRTFLCHAGHSLHDPYRNTNGWATTTTLTFWHRSFTFNPLKPELIPICYLLALLAHHFLHVSRIRVKPLTLRWLMSYIYIYGAPILDVSRSHTTTQHSR